LGADIAALALAETSGSKTDAWSRTEAPGSAFTAGYFFLSCQEEVTKKKARPPRRPAAPGALRCSVGRGGCATRRYAAQTVLAEIPPSALRCSTTQRAKQKAARINHKRQHCCLVGSPCGAPSNAGKPGEVGEHCLRAVGPSCAAAWLDESRREVGAADRRECSADRGAGGRLLFGDFFLATQEKVTRRQGGTQRLRFLATLGMTAHPPSARNPA
jgi:hypothetical protein